jgi:hypothetical protein
MLNLCEGHKLCEGHVFVELNYPHFIGISGYELHHDVATCAGIFPGNSTAIHGVGLAPIVPNLAIER